MSKSSIGGSFPSITSNCWGWVPSRAITTWIQVDYLFCETGSFFHHRLFSCRCFQFDTSASFSLTLTNETSSRARLSLRISRMRLDQGGFYKCEASNYLGHVTRAKRVDVYGPPYVRPMEERSVVAEADAWFHCPYSGYPIQRISWSKDGELRSLPILCTVVQSCCFAVWYPDTTKENYEVIYAIAHFRIIGNLWWSSLGLAPSMELAHFISILLYWMFLNVLCTALHHPYWGDR